jgi:hypothetical protein
VREVINPKIASSALLLSPSPCPSRWLPPDVETISRLAVFLHSDNLVILGTGEVSPS